VPKINGQQWDFFSTFIIFSGSLKIPKLPKIFWASWNFFLLNLLKHQGFWGSQDFEQKWIFFNLYYLPKIIRQKRIPKLPKTTLSILEKNSEESSRVPKFLEKFLSFLNLPNFFCIVWTTPQCKQFKVGLT
jgi:hypothetical protein